MVFIDFLGWIPGNVKSVSINFVHLYDTYITRQIKIHGAFSWGLTSILSGVFTYSRVPNKRRSQINVALRFFPQKLINVA